LPAVGLDTAIAAYLIDPAETRYAVADLLTKYTGATLPTDDTDHDRAARLRGEHRSTTPAGPPARPSGSAGWRPLSRARSTAQGMLGLYAEIENPLVLVLAKMEHVGIGVDVDELRALGKRLSDECLTLQAQLREVAGRGRPEPQLAQAAA
jgi:DNA polymerase I